MRISMEEAPAKLPELAQLAHSGGEVVITKDGQPYLRLVACEGYKPQPRRPNPYRGTMSDEAIDVLLAPLTKDEVLKLFWDGKTE